MERLGEILSHARLPWHGARDRVIALAVLALLATLLVACQAAATPTEEPSPPHLQLLPCGDEVQVQQSGSSAWRAVEAPTAVEGGARMTAEGEDGGRLCTADGSVLELGPRTTIDVGPAEDASRLEISVQDGSLLFLALEPAYQIVAPGCLLRVSEVPARISVALNSEATRLRMEEGQGTLITESETITVEMCSEIIAAAGAEPQISQYCAATPEPTPTFVTRTPTPEPTATSEPTETPTPSPTPSPTPTSTPTPTPTRRVIVPTSTPTPLPPTDTPVPTSPPQDTREPPQDTKEPPPTATPEPIP